MIAETGAFSAIRTSQISTIEITTQNLPKWPFAQGAQWVENISPEQFRERFQVESYVEARRKASTSAGQIQLGFTELEMVTGQVLIWEVVMESKELTGMDILPYINSLIGSHGLYAIQPGHGAIIVNPNNMRAARFLPGPPGILPKVLQLRSNDSNLA
jgi:hypothetical protein